MKTLYIECGMGAAGDMLTAALLELVEEPKVSIDKINKLGIPGVISKAEKTEKCGVTGTHVSVTVDGIEEESLDVHDHQHGYHHEHEHHHGHHHKHEHEHEHNSMHNIEEIVKTLNASDVVKKDILSVYKIVAMAESKVHNTPIDEIHFHEVGSKDALCDIAAVCMLIEELSPSKIVVSPINVGFGHVHCAHGILPVPAPATAEIIKGIPIYAGNIEGELCTPTGAALLKFFATEFGEMPNMVIEKIGYGMGKKDFSRANCVRAFLGDTNDKEEDVLEISFNIDDMTAEEIAYATKKLIDTTAVDVFTTSIGMKKSRPGTMVTVICHPKDREEVIREIFANTTTLGVRMHRCSRNVLSRTTDIIETPLGRIRNKISSGYGTRKSKLEYEDLVDIIDKKNYN